VHFDLYPHNILLTNDRVLFADWPHARLGVPLLDLLIVLSTAAADGIDPEPILRQDPLTAGTAPHTIDAVLAALAGFSANGALHPPVPGLEPITAAKRTLSRTAVAWLHHRLTSPRLRRP
jgi:hypothetical protein